MLGTCGDQKRVSDPLELRVIAGMSCYVGAGNQNLVSRECSKSFLQLSPNYLQPLSRRYSVVYKYYFISYRALEHL